MSFAALTAGVPFRVSVVAGLRASGAASITILRYIEWDTQMEQRATVKAWKMVGEMRKRKS